MPETTIPLEELAEVHTGLRQMMTGHWSARVLQAANGLGVFSTLAGRASSASELASTIGTHPRATEMLLRALVSMGLLEKKQEQYALSAVGRMFLVEGSDYYQGQLIQMYSQGFGRWERLEEAVRRGGLEVDQGDFDPNYVRSMSNSASVTAPLAVRRLDISKVTHLLDVGGGPATYTIALARARADLKADVLDLEPATAVAREYIDAAGLSGRVKTIPGDYLSADFGQARYDMVLLSNVLHHNTTDGCKKLLKKAFDALTSEGMCVANDFLLSDDKTGPLMSALFGVNMLVTTAAGATYSGWEVTDMMQSVGFIRVQIVTLDPTPYSMVVGVRP